MTLFEHDLPTIRRVHLAVPERVRLRDHRLRGRDDLCAAVVRSLGASAQGVTVEASSLTGSILVRGSCLDVDLIEAVIADTLDEAMVSGCAHSLSSAAQGGREPWHARPPDIAVRATETSSSEGLDPAEAANRLAEGGPNVLPKAEPRSAADIVVEQVETLPVALLGASALLALFTGGVVEAAVILGVVALNAGIAAVTERRAERTIAGLSAYDPRPIEVIRGGLSIRIHPGDLVPGDVVVLEPGTLVPADARLLFTESLAVNEAALTGEAMPVQKNAALLLRDDAVLADRTNMVFRGTAVTGGRGLAVVVATGVDTEIGQLQSMLGTLQPPQTPIQRQLGEVERELVMVNGLICAAVFAIGLARGQPLISLLRSAISLAIAAIPEGLPAVATTTLALGVKEMERRRIYVRRLDAVETLGSVDVIGLDKTGTLTGPVMSMAMAHCGGRLLRLATGVPQAEDGETPPTMRSLVVDLLTTAILASEAQVSLGPEGVIVAGTATETAIFDAAQEAGIDVGALIVERPVVKLVQRSDGRKRVSVLRGDRSCATLQVKGDPAEVLALSALINDGTTIRPIDDGDRLRILTANETMAGRALRVLGVARREGGDPSNETDLVWMGLLGIENPIRAEVPSTLQHLHHAGIRTVMITGDQSATAYAVAKSLRLSDQPDVHVLEAGRLVGMEPEVLAALVDGVDVFARVSPSEKLAIVRALQSRGRIVAMTGDGINDGPALKAAHVGVAMGVNGTDVAREVADIVLATDDLQGIVDAVRLGRSTYANIRKVLRFLVGTGISETFLMLASSVIGIREPLNPLQLLLLNLATDVFPAIALGLEPPDADAMDLPPLDPAAPILGVHDFRRLLREGGVIGGFALAGHLLDPQTGRNGSTVTFHGLTLAQLLHAFSCRSERGGLVVRRGRPVNRKLRTAVIGCIGLQSAVQLFPVSRRVFGLRQIGAGELLAILTIALGATIVNEVIDATLSSPRPPNPEASPWPLET